MPSTVLCRGLWISLTALPRLPSIRSTYYAFNTLHVLDCLERRLSLATLLAIILYRSTIMYLAVGGNHRVGVSNHLPRRTSLFTNFDNSDNAEWVVSSFVHSQTLTVGDGSSRPNAQRIWIYWRFSLTDDHISYTSLSFVCNSFPLCVNWNVMCTRDSNDLT